MPSVAKTNEPVLIRSDHAASHSEGMNTTENAAGPLPAGFDDAVETVAKRLWIERVIGEDSSRQWAEDAWDDMGGSEPSWERAELVAEVREVLLAARQSPDMLIKADARELIARAELMEAEDDLRTEEVEG